MSQSKIQAADLLLKPVLSLDEMTALLRHYHFIDVKKADANLQLIADGPTKRVLLAELLPTLLETFSRSADPDRGLNHFERFTKTSFSKTTLFGFLKTAPHILSQLGLVLGGSNFLADLLIRNPEYFYWVFDPEVLQNSKAKASLLRELRQGMRLLTNKPDRLDWLRIFKRKETLRIGLRDLLRIATVSQTIKEVSNLADILISEAHKICEETLRSKYGAPCRVCGQGRSAGFCVIALGKLGSRELNFSSDVDLIYVYDKRAGETTGGSDKSVIQNPRYYELLSREISAALNESTREGYLYRVDLRLRPEGDMGLITQPLQGYRSYYEKRGETWERLVLLRARCISGGAKLGRDFLDLIRPFIYQPPCRESEIKEIKAFKDRIDEIVDLKHQRFLDVKRGFGGIREIEFIVQTLQLCHGERLPELRCRGTIAALSRLKRHGLLRSATSFMLKRAYLFLRDVENKIQMLDDQQTHLIPSDDAGVAALAKRLRYSDKSDQSAASQFKSDYLRHINAVHLSYKTLFFTSNLV